ncbi:hypothetical protein GC173_14150 [bacterium]|nr:hypothetical protein [bacterium]
MIRSLLILLTFVLLGGCAHREPPVVRPALPQRPVAVWIDSDWMRSELADPAKAEATLRGLADAGVTIIGIETLDWNGAPTAAVADPIRDLAQRLGLRTAAIVPCFTPTPTDGRELLVHSAQWRSDRWEVTPLAPPRLSPVTDEARERLVAHVAALRDPLVILSGFGFEDMAADVGPAAQRSFESWSARAARDWPAEVLGAPPPRLPWGPEGRGPLWDSWTLWRADLLSRLLLRVRGALPPTANLLVVVDAPYQVHQRQGVNWAPPTSAMLADYPWLPPQYLSTSVTHLVDGLVLAYWRPDLVKREEAMAQDYAWWASIEGSASAAAGFMPESVRSWALIVADERGDWARAISAGRRTGGGLLIVGLRGKLVGGADWERLRASLR